MIDLNYIKENSEKFSELMKNRNIIISVEDILRLEIEKKNITSNLQELQTERNLVSKVIGTYKKEKKNTLHLEDKVT